MKSLVGVGYESLSVSELPVLTPFQSLWNSVEEIKLYSFMV